MTIAETQKAAPFFKFENLRIYHKSLQFSEAVLAIYDHAVTDSDRMVAKLYFEAACSITNNIIEGSSVAKSAFVDYLQKAKSGIRECVTYTAILHDRKVIDEEQLTDIRNELIELTKMAGALIVSLQSENN